MLTQLLLMSPRTTRLYNRTQDAITLDEVEFRFEDPNLDHPVSIFLSTDNLQSALEKGGSLSLNSQMRKSFLNLCSSTVAFVLVGCAGLPSLSTNHIAVPTQASYIEVDYRRFVSGVYVNELGGKYVQVKCTFSSTMSSLLPNGYSPNQYMAFTAIAPVAKDNIQAVLSSPEMLTIDMPWKKWTRDSPKGRIET